MSDAMTGSAGRILASIVHPQSGFRQVRLQLAMTPF